jgi:luciferase family oxidoreductase group 1
LDLATVGRGETVADSLHGSVLLAQAAERSGYERVWYAEHHNISAIASSATAVLIAHVAAHTSTIRLGSGGVMLPNHSPLTIAEQFGTLASLHPGRIDLGLGRAPGTDGATLRALRRSPMAAEAFPEDVMELAGYLSDRSPNGIEAIPGRGTHVPIYILGSSLFGARLAARMGVPYAFASHFAPRELEPAMALYRREFRPSAQLAAPYAIAAANVVCAPTGAEAEELAEQVRRYRANALLGGGRDLSDAQLDALLASPSGRAVEEMMRYAAIGDPETVGGYLARFAEFAGADEVMTVHALPTAALRVRSVELARPSVSAGGGRPRG